MTRIVRRTKSRRGIPALLNKLANRRLVRLAAGYYRDRGHKLAVFANDSTGIAINTYGIYEKEELTALFEFLRPVFEEFRNGVAIDVGANIGNHMLYFSKLFKTVHAFEPNPTTFRLLEFNANWTKNCVVHNAGLGRERGHFWLVEEPTNLGASHIVIEGAAGDGGLEVTVERLDELPFDKSEICFIKIDVEGFEASVLKGGIATIRKTQPVIAFEQRKQDFVNGSSEAIEILRELGYVFCWHEGGSSSKRWLFRRCANCWELFGGRREDRIIAGTRVPEGYHSMIVGIPQRFRKVLRLQ